MTKADDYIWDLVNMQPYDLCSNVQRIIIHHCKHVREFGREHLKPEFGFDSFLLHNTLYNKMTSIYPIKGLTDSANIF
jgi:hypothetical protein